MTKYNSFIQENLLNWINTINDPNCLILSSLNDLYDGRIFLFIIQHLFDIYRINKNEILIDSENLDTYERFNSIFNILRSFVSNSKELEKIEVIKDRVNLF